MEFTAFEFEVVVKNGVINVPEEYLSEVKGSVRVLIFIQKNENE